MAFNFPIPEYALSKTRLPKRKVDGLTAFVTHTPTQKHMKKFKRSEHSPKELANCQVNCHVSSICFPVNFFVHSAAQIK